jgi:putative DNA primase/helicase
MKSAALWYAKNGIPVFPLHWPKNGGCSCGKGDCHSPGKHPLTPRGFKDATTNKARVSEWWDTYQSANIGLPTGAVSGFLVVDCDPRNGGPSERGELVQQFGLIPDTAEVITGGGGRHFFFRFVRRIRG